MADPAETIPEIDARLIDAITSRDEVIRRLRVVLEPLLDDPWRLIASDGGPDNRCVLCDDERHAPDCPVLRKDELLGRS